MRRGSIGWLLTPLIVVAVGFSLWPAGTVHADTFGRAINQLYYTGTTDPYHEWLFQTDGATPYQGVTADWDTKPGGITVDDFINGVQVRLFDNSALPGADINRARASGLVNTMMGVHGDDPRFGPGPAPTPGHWKNGVALAQQNFATWTGIVRQYAANGWIEMNVPRPVCYGDVDGFGAVTDSTATVQIPDIVFGQISSGNPGDCTDAVSIVFHIDGSLSQVFRISEECANLSGVETAFSDFDIQTALQSGAGTPIAGTSLAAPALIPPGGPYQVVPQAWNAGPGTVTPGETYQLTVPNGITVTNTNGGAQVGNTITWTNVTFPGVGPGNSVSKLVDWTIPATTAGGTILQFTFQVSPAGLTTPGPTSPISIFYKVQSIRDPAFVAQNGDVHAGGGLCSSTTAPVAGNVLGYPAAGSNGEYVIAASGAITGVKSNGPTAPDSLKIGASGGYSSVCRPDLLAAANAYIAAGGGINFGLPFFDVTGQSGVFYYNGAGPLYIYGTVTQKLTIVVRSNAKVVIRNPFVPGNASPLVINAAAANLGANQPSLGIIASGDISIPFTTTRVDAYLFSSTGVINTCTDANGNAPAAGSTFCSTPALNVNGFLMAQTILFDRLGPLNTNGTVVTEQISLNPQIYLNPPQFFGADVDDLLLEGQGEKSPLF